MAGQSRTLKLSILADVDQLKKSLTSANNEVDNSASRISDFSKKAAVAFAAAGAAVGAFAISAVKAAAEDETAQTKLQETIRNTTNATAEQIAGIDKYVTAQSIATATTDDVIRPALSRLLRATGDLTKSQELLTLSQEISVATGKPLEAVTNAVAKSFEGSNTSLAKLGIGIDAATLKTMTFDETQQLLNKTFDGFIANQSETAAFKFQQISIAVNESKEAIGAALLPVVKELADFIIVSVVPAIESFVAGLTGQDSLADGLSDTQKKAIEWGKNVRKVIDTVIDLKDELKAVAIVIGTVFVISKISAGVVATIALVNSLIKAYNLLKASAIVAGVASAFALNPLLGVAAVAIGAAVLAGANALANSSNVSGADAFATSGAPGAISGRAVAGDMAGYLEEKDGNIINKLTGKVVGKSKGLTGVTQSSVIAGAFTDSQNAAKFAGAGTVTDSQKDANISITVNGAIDPESTARQIVSILNDSSYRGTGGASALVGI
jgi:hypothetical protein